MRFFLLIFLTSKITTCYTDGVTSGMISQLSGSEHQYWILGLEREVHSTWFNGQSGLEECMGNFFRSGTGHAMFSLSAPLLIKG